MNPSYGAYAAPAWAQSQRTGEVGIKAVLLLLANYADENYSCYPSQKRIADETEQSERTVRRHIEILMAVGLISKTHRYGSDGKRTSDRFQLHLDRTVTKGDVKAARARLASDKVSALDTKREEASSEDEKSLADTVTGSDSEPTTGHQMTSSGDYYRSPATVTTGHGEHDYRSPGVRVTPKNSQENSQIPAADASGGPDSSIDETSDGTFALEGVVEGKTETQKEQAYRIVREYLAWFETKTGAPVVGKTRVVEALRKSYVEVALTDGATEDQIKRALANSGSEQPTMPQWRRVLREAMGGTNLQTVDSQFAPRHSSYSDKVWESDTPAIDAPAETEEEAAARAAAWFDKTRRTS